MNFHLVSGVFLIVSKTVLLLEDLFCCEKLTITFAREMTVNNKLFSVFTGIFCVIKYQ